MRVLNRAVLVAVLLVVGYVAFGWATRPLRGRDPASRAVKDHVLAARRGECEAVFEGFSSSTQRLMNMRLGRPPTWCTYAPGPAALDEMLPDTVRLVDGGSNRSIVGVTYTYDRFFGFFGRGRDRADFVVVREGGSWKVDHTEELDPESRTNRNRRAMFGLHQAVLVERDSRRDTGAYTTDAAAMRARLPGYEFPPIRTGVATRDAKPDEIFVAVAPDVACISTLSATGLLVMIKLSDAPTWQYGRIPARCDARPLSRRYTGTSSVIRS